MESTARTVNKRVKPAEFFTLEISVRLTKLVVALLGCILMLSILSLIANVMWVQQRPGAGTAIELFSVDREGSLPAWWSALLLAVLGGLCWLIARQKRQAPWGERLAWWALTGGFFFLSIDEACMLHERFGRKIRLEGSLYHARWILLWLPPALLATGAILWRLWRASRRLVLGMAAGVLVFLSGAVGIETLNARYRYGAETLARTEAQLPADGSNPAPALRDWQKGPSYYPYVLGTALEEFLEMLGPIIWLVVLLTAYKEQAQGQEAPHAEQLE
jgi:hypothetical protein